MTAKMNMKSWYTIRMLKTFFRDVTTQSKTACGEESQISQRSGEITNNRLESVCRRRPLTLSLGSLLMVLRGRRTLSTRRDFMVLMSRPLLFLLNMETQHSGKERCSSANAQIQRSEDTFKNNGGKDKNTVKSKKVNTSACQNKITQWHTELHFVRRTSRRQD